MQTIPQSTPEHLTYGIQLWQLNCLYWDGRDYRYSRTHSAVEPALRGRIAVPVNAALKSRFASPAALRLYTVSAKGNSSSMQTQADTLRAVLPRGSSVYTVVTRESRTGANCHVLLLAIVQGEIVSLSAAAAALLGLTVEFSAVRIAKPRMSAGATLAHQLAIALYQDARALRQSALG